MDALVGIVLALFLPLVIPLAVLILGFALLFASLGLLARLQGRKTPQPAVGGAEPLPPRGRSVIRRAWPGIAAGASALVLAGVFIANSLYFEPILRWVFADVGNRTGYHVTFEQAEGSLIAGRLSLTAARIQRDGGEGVGADLTIEQLAIGIRVPSLFSRHVVLDQLSVSGVSGWVSRGVRDGDGAATASQTRRRTFTAEDLALEDVRLDVLASGGQTYRIEIAQARSQPFRSQLAVFDLFFRSNLEAEFDGIPLKVETATTSERTRTTQWAFEGVPVQTLAALTDRAPFRWLTGGTVSSWVNDEWSLDDTAIDMDWRVVFDGVAASPPPGTGVTEQIAARALGSMLARKGGDADIAFTLSLDEDGLARNGSADLSALYEALRDGIAAAWAAAGSDTPEATGNAIDTLRDRLFNRQDNSTGNQGAGN